MRTPEEEGKVVYRCRYENLTLSQAKEICEARYWGVNFDADAKVAEFYTLLRFISHRLNG